MFWLSELRENSDASAFYLFIGLESHVNHSIDLDALINQYHVHFYLLGLKFC